MPHVREIPTSKLAELSNVPFGKGTLFGVLDNAGQHIWLEIMGIPEKLVSFAPEVATADRMRVAAKFSARSFGGSAKATQFGADDLHQLLSLEHFLQPESEAGREVQQAIVLGLEKLGLPKVIPPEQLKEKLPALFASMKATIEEQNRKGGWIG